MYMPYRHYDEDNPSSARCISYSYCCYDEICVPIVVVVVVVVVVAVAAAAAVVVIVDRRRCHRHRCFCDFPTKYINGIIKMLQSTYEGCSYCYFRRRRCSWSCCCFECCDSTRNSTVEPSSFSVPT
jgi:hypothetical protein